MSKQKFSSNKLSRLEEVYFVADEAGLVRDSKEYEKTKSDRYPYWHDPETGRKFRYNEETNCFDISTLDMDRWANSQLISVDLPKTLEELSLLIQQVHFIPDPKPVDESIKQKVPHSRKCKNIRHQ